MFNDTRNKHSARKPVCAEKLSPKPVSGNRNRRRLGYYESFLKTPNLDDPGIIEKLVEKLKHTVVETELHNVEGCRLQAGETVRCEFGTVMAMLQASDSLAIKMKKSGRIIEQERSFNKVEMIRRFEKVYRDYLAAAQDVRQLMQDTEELTFARLFSIYLSTDLNTFVDMYCAKDDIDELQETMDWFSKGDNSRRLVVGDILMPVACSTNNFLLMSYDRVFLHNDNKTVFDLNVDAEIINSIKGELGSETFIFTNLLMRPFSDEVDYNYYLGLGGA